MVLEMKVYGFKVESVFISVKDLVLSLNGLWFYTIAAYSTEFRAVYLSVS